MKKEFECEGHCPICGSANRAFVSKDLKDLKDFNDEYSIVYKCTDCETQYEEHYSIYSIANDDRCDNCNSNDYVVNEFFVVGKYLFMKCFCNSCKKVFHLITEIEYHNTQI